jgi:hypothetical protein
VKRRFDSHAARTTHEEDDDVLGAIKEIPEKCQSRRMQA